MESAGRGPLAQAGVTLHGPAWPLAMRALDAAVPGGLSPFSANDGISLASVWLAYLCLRLAVSSEAAGLLGACALLGLPVRLRLAATESEFVLLEFLSLAAFLFFILWRRGGGRFLALGLLCAGLLMQTRAEMLACAPLILAAYLAASGSDLPAGWLASPALRGAGAGAALLCVPRAAQVLAWRGDRGGLLASPGSLFAPGAGSVNAFFDPSLTPPQLWALLALGLAFLFVRRKALFLAVAAHLAFLTQFYAPQLNCLAVEARTALATQYLFAGVAALGAYGAGLSLPGRWANAAWIGLALSFLLAPAGYRGFLTRHYTAQQEFRFLAGALPGLARGSIVAYLRREEAEADAPVPGPTGHEEKLMRFLAPDLEVIGLSRLLAWSGAQAPGKPAGRTAAGEGPGVYFYEGVNCLTDFSSRDPGKDFVQPLCGAVEGAFELAPLARDDVTNETHSPESIAGPRRTIGLYKVGSRRGPKARGKGNPAASGLAARAPLPEPRASAPVRWALAASRGLEAAGLGRAAGWALGLAGRWAAAADDWRALGRSRLRRGEHGAAAQSLARACAAGPATGPAAGGLWLELAQASALAGDRPGALAALGRAAAAGLEPALEGRAAVLYQDLGELGRARGILERLVRDRPDDARLRKDLEVLKALMGGPGKASGQGPGKTLRAGAGKTGS